MSIGTAAQSSQLARRRSVVTAVVVAAMLFGAGLFVGLRLSWGTKSPAVFHGVAMRANDVNDLVMFDADNGEQVDFAADSIWWESEGAGGDSDPPCLRVPLRKVQVNVGVRRIATPGGGSFLKARLGAMPMT